MTRFSKTFLLLGTAILALNACTTKGPGDIGSKDDIVVKNNGLPQAQQQAAVKAEGEDFTSKVEQAEAIPTPEVAAGESLPDTSPAMETAVAQHEAAQAPIAPDTASPADATSASVSETRPLDNVAPTTPVNAAVIPPPADAPATSVAPAPVSASVAAPSLAPASTAAYPLDPNAPYSPKAVAAANAAEGVPPVAPVTAPAVATTATPIAQQMPAISATGINFNNPSVIRSAQAALKQKGLYKGAESGIVDTEFLNALTIYQTGNQLPVGGINEPTLRYLGVIE